MSKGVKKKGFTLVELVVVLAIFGLLASITGLGLYSWTRYSVNKENNENARTIFLAAQESLTHMQASGTLSEYADLIIKEENKTPAENIQPVINSNISSRLYTIFYTPGSLENRTLSTNEEVRKMLSPYLEGTDVFNHAFAIEFDPQDGVVYSVFYSKKADSLSYDIPATSRNESGVVGIAQRESSFLNDRLVGYYVADLTDIRPTQGPQIIVTEPVTPKPLLVNEEELYVHFDLGADYQEFEKYEYEIKIYSSNDSKLIVTLNISKTEVAYIKSGKSKTVLASADYGDGKTNSIRLKAEIRNNGFDVILDAMDIQTLTKYNNLTRHDNGKLNIINGTKNKNDFSSFKDTYSIFNLFQDLEAIDFYSIYCDVRVNVVDKSGKSAVINKSSGVEDIMFAGRKIEGNGDKTVMYPEIKYLRHLFNVCYWEKINESSNKQLNITYKQKADIVYSNKYIYNSSSPNTTIDSFITVPTLGSASTYQGEGNSIIDLKLDSNVLNAENIGIFGLNKGTIKDLNIKNASLNSNISSDSSGSGLIAGKNENIISGVEVTLTGNANKNAGGIVGINEGTIQNCVANGEVTGENNIGGISGINIGVNNIDNHQNKGIISECTSSVNVYAETISSSNLGGIVGKNKKIARIENCKYISIRNLNKVIDSFEINPFSCSKSAGKEYLLYGENIGGIIGHNLSGRIINCSTVAEDSDNNAYILGYKNIGGIIGRDDNANQGRQDVYINNNKNSLNIIGIQQLGGIVGSLEGGQDGNSSAHNNITIADCINYGVTVLVKKDQIDNKTLDAKLAGGITSWLGKNGEIRNCTVAVDINDTTKIKLLEFSGGDYVGGITGQNRGKIYIYNSSNEHTVLVKGDDYVGGLVGINEGASPDNTDYDDNRPCEIINQFITAGIVKGDNCVGGMIGTNQKSINIGNAAISNIVVSGNYCVGGLVGWNRRDLQGYDTNSHVITSVSGVDNVGGLIGLNDNVTIKGQIINITNQVTGNDNVGGLIGYNNGNVFYSSDIYNKVNVFGEKNVGGVIGYNAKGSKLEHCLVKDSTINCSKENVGGLIGYNDGTVTFENNPSKKNDLKINCLANFVGGLTGYNDKNGIIERAYLSDTSEIKGYDYVGWLSGYNAGYIYSADLHNPTDYNNQITNIVNVEGNKYVGGLVGLNEIGNVYQKVVGGTVTGTDYVGGAYGCYKDKNNSDISISTNIEGVTVVGNNIGGLTGCFDIGPGAVVTVNSHAISSILKGSSSGGIVSVVEKNNTLKVTSISEIRIEIESGNAGGIAAINYGTIANSTIKDSSFTYKTNNCNVGAVAGINEGIINNVISINNVLNNSESVSPLSEGDIASNVGRLVGINGSIYKLNNNDIKIEQCKVVNLIGDGEILKDLVGLNISSEAEYHHFESTDNNNIWAALNNNITKTDVVRILDPTNSDNIWEFSFYTGENSDDKYLLKIYGLYVHNGTIEQRLLKESNCSTAGTEWRLSNNTCTYKITLDSADKINGFRIQVDHYADNTNYNDLKFFTVSERSYFFDVSLPDIEYNIVRSEDKKHFIVEFVPVSSPDKNYIQNYSLIYELSDNEISIEKNLDDNATSVELDLSNYAGDKVKFSVIAKVVNDNSVYRDSDIIWSQEFDIGEASQMFSLPEENNSNENIVPVIQETHINNEEGENGNETVTQE